MLVDDASTATANLPAPDTAVTQLLARGYQLEYRAGNDCYSAGSTDTALLARSAGERAAGLGLLDQALALVAERTGASVSTTTTTSAQLGRALRMSGPGPGESPTTSTGCGAGSCGPCRPASTSSGAGPGSGPAVRRNLMTANLVVQVATEPKLVGWPSTPRR